MIFWKGTILKGFRTLNQSSNLPQVNGKRLLVTGFHLLIGQKFFTDHHMLTDFFHSSQSVLLTDLTHLLCHLLCDDQIFWQDMLYVPMTGTCRHNSALNDPLGFAQALFLSHLVLKHWLKPEKWEKEQKIQALSLSTV